ncbi:SRPBCC domain-containing protein [Acinetobacter baumannii]|uniref:SRPBCC domain-containing protein n=1 Tax=Acinetobacter baumannii TaxID=470 RepID=UPI00234CAC46|nr:SRPBCC domain-containing protein [Acinetobacter baumannii]MDC7429289.1 SRPBCC domain-containing protein [Acinetobacter baumannii]MDC7466694.1 SRPBCC domain-containing protein [Acinetobacter baumannii]
MMNSINWPEGYLPGETDNFCSNEMIVKGLTTAEVWPYLVNAYVWPSYYANSSNVQLPDGSEQLCEDMVFFFETFGFPVDAHIVEFVAPKTDEPARIAWHGWAGEMGTAERLDVHHAWLIEDLEGGRVRILTQETQNGQSAKELAQVKPNPMINGHQDWLDGLVTAVSRAKKIYEVN